MEHSKLKICFSCANIYETHDSDILVCPHCGHQVSLTKYEEILGSIRNAVHYGWKYRLSYEKQLKEEGKINTHLFIIPYEEIINFVALAIASGIIGGFAYDVIKKVISKICEFAKKNGSKEDADKLFSLIGNEENMKKFMLYIDQYYTCFDCVDEAVRNAIYEEMLVDRYSSTLDNLIKGKNPDIDIDWIKKISPFSDEDIFKGMLEVRKQPKKGEPCRENILQDFWSHIDN